MRGDSRVILDFDLSWLGNGDRYLCTEWAEADRTYRWTFESETRLVMPVEQVDCGDMVVISGTPCLDPPVHGLP